MNRTHRVIWSESRQAFIVTSEKAKAKGKPSSTRKAIASAVVMALAAMAAQPAMAVDVCGAGPTTINTAQTPGDNCILSTGDSLTVTGDGVISVTGASAVQVSFGATVGSISNSGTISGGSGIYVSGATAGSILNSGTITSTNAAVNIQNSSITGNIENNGVAASISGSTGIYIGGGSIGGSIINSGTIAGTGWGSGIYISNSSTVMGDISNDVNSTISGGTGGSAAGINLSSSSITGGITNSGTISGLVGINISNSSTVTGGITNNAGCIISGSSSNGIYLSGSSVGSIVNSGSITGRDGAVLISISTVESITNNAGGTISGTGQTGLRIQNTSSISGGIVNDGTISGGQTGLYISNNSSVAGDITNSGTIEGVISSASGTGYGMSLSGGSTVGSIINSGTIRGIGGTSNGTGYGMFLSGSSTTVGSITNSGTISGSSTGIYLSNSSSVGSITNNAGGTISGDNTGIYLINSSIGSLTNSGTISGGTYAIYDVSITTIDNIDIAGTNTASFIGMVNAPNTAMSILNGASYTLKTADAFTVASFTNNGTAMFAAGASSFDLTNVAGNTFTNNGVLQVADGGTGTITGNYTQTANGVLQVGVTDDTTYGKLVITGAADISTSNNFAVNVVGSPLLTVGTTLSNVLASTGSLTTGATLSATDNSALYDFNAVKNANAVDIVIAPAAGVTISGGTGNIFTSVGALDGAVVLPATAILNLDGTVGSIVGAVTGGADSTVNVNGTFTTGNTFSVGAFNIASGGLLNMAHGVTTTTGFTNVGTLAVAAGTTATITGNYTQTANGVLQAGVTDDTTYGKLVVTGTATLPANAKIDVNVANPNFAFTATSMAGVITAGTLTSDGTFTVTDNSVLFDFTASKSGNAVDLALAVASSGGGGSGAAVNATGNTPAAGAAAVLDDLAAAFAGGGTGNADMDTVIIALGQLSSQQAVSDAVGQTLPLMTGGMAQATSANLNGVNRVVQARQEENRGLSSGEGFATNGKAWIKPLGSWADQDNSGGAFGYAAKTYGLAFGTDGERSTTTRLGAALAYSHSNVDSNSGAQTATVNSYQAVLYGSNSLNDSTEFNWQADYGYNQNKGNRYIAFVNRTALADYTSQSLHLGAGIGHTIAMNERTSVTPSFHADYTSIRDNGYTETGAGALNLVVNSKTTDEFILSVDSKVNHKLDNNATVAANLGLGYDVNAKQNSVTAAFAGGGAAFTTSGINPSATLVRGGLGYVSNTTGGVEITARYDVEARTGFTGQTASVKARWAF